MNLRFLWATAKTQHPIIEDFDIDPYYAVQIVVLVARSTPSCKRGDVLDLKASDIEQWWERSIDGLRAVFTLLQNDCGVAAPKWLPYNTILSPLAAVPSPDARSREVPAWALIVKN